MTKQDTMTYAAILTAGIIAHDPKPRMNADDAANIMVEVVHALELRFPELRQTRFEQPHT